MVDATMPLADAPQGFLLMDGICSVWDHCPADTNAVERKNQDSEDKAPQQLQSAVINR